MSDEWEDQEGEPDPWAGTGWAPEQSLGDPDAWRGESAADPDAWRGEQHLLDWPVWNAGPEYRMWKQRKDRDKPDA